MSVRQTYVAFLAEAESSGSFTSEIRSQRPSPAVVTKTIPTTDTACTVPRDSRSLYHTDSREIETLPEKHTETSSSSDRGLA